MESNTSDGIRGWAIQPSSVLFENLYASEYPSIRYSWPSLPNPDSLLDGLVESLQALTGGDVRLAPDPVSDGTIIEVELVFRIGQSLAKDLIRSGGFASTLPVIRREIAERIINSLYDRIDGIELGMDNDT